MNKLKNPQEDKQTFTAVGFTFLGAGVVFFLNESLRTMSYAFLVLGITFLIIGMGNKAKKN
jgi:hypothetical protein